MSNVERKNVKFKIILILAIAATIAFIAVFFMRPSAESNREETAAEIPFESVKIEYTKGKDTAFVVKIRNDVMKNFLEERGVDVPVVFSFLPEELEVSGEGKINLFTADGYVSVLLMKMNINGFEVPQKLLSDIGEIKLDFKRSLVYN